MPALPPYIPSQQAKFSAWLANFSTLITAAPATYGLLAGDAVTIAGYYSTWLAAYTPVTSAATRTAALVAAKNNAYAGLLPLIRGYAQTIANNAGVNTSDKIALGLNPKTSTPSAITPPSSTPVLVVQYAASGQIVLRYRDSAASVSVKSKPYGAIALRLFGKTSATPITDASTLPFLAQATKSPFVLSTVGMTSGGTIYLAAAWVTRRGGQSGLSPVIATVVV